MAKVICRLPNASSNIDGIEFQPHPDGNGMVSADISDEQAARFLSIPGYEAVAAKGSRKAAVTPPATPAPTKPPVTGATTSEATEDKKPSEGGATDKGGNAAGAADTGGAGAPPNEEIF